MANQKAPKGKVYQCYVCSKRSKDKYGDEPLDYGWDVSCVMHSHLVTIKQAKKNREEFLEQMKKTYGEE